jgi:hypothetical protein
MLGWTMRGREGAVVGVARQTATGNSIVSLWFLALRGVWRAGSDCLPVRNTLRSCIFGRISLFEG